MILGHQKQWRFLKQSAELDKLSHAYLFSGPEKIGKKTLAIEFVKWLFNVEEYSLFSTLRSARVNEDIEKRQHPDFFFVEPEKKEIQISQIRELNWKISLKPSLNSFKTAVIDQAHSMNQEAQNCFLKTLEEPKGKTLLILISEFPELLFPTVLSRVQKIKFYPVNSVEIENYLKTQGISESQTQEIIQLSMGRPGIAVDFISDSKKLAERKQKIEELIRIFNSDLTFRFQYAKDLSKEENLRETLNIWLNYFRSLLLKGNVQAQGYSLTKLKNILRQIQNINFLISTTNVNSRLALEILMLEL